MKKIARQIVSGLVLAVLVLLVLQGQAQQNEPPKEETVIYYKDGSVFRGQIIKDDPLHYQMVLATLDTITINKAMIGRFASARNMRLFKRGKFHYKDGVYVYATGMLGGGDGNYTALTDITLGYRTKPNQSVGIGAGLAISDIWLASTWLEHEFTTVFLYGRQYLSKSGARFYFDTRLGYGFPRVNENVIGDDHNGGVHFQPGIGLHFASKSGLKWHLGLARFIQRTSGQDVTTGPFNQPIETDFKLWYSRTVFKIGIEIR